MAERNTTIQGVRDRLTGLLADWGAEMSLVLKELEEQRARVAELEGGAAGRHDELQALQKRVDGQQNLIDALRGDAEEASKMRNEVRDKDLEFERVSSELDSKKELIRALRRDAESADRLKTDAKVKDRDIEELRAQLKRAEAKAEQATQEAAAAHEAADGRVREEQSEVETLRSELEARKTLIKSLRADQDRVATLQASLEEKREIIAELEASMNRHSNTIADLRRSGEQWKRKYLSAKGDSGTATTSINLPTLSDTDVRVIEHIEKVTDQKMDSTIAIDMRRSLLEARRTAAQGSGEK
jgi:chromosome segregation ATPase